MTIQSVISLPREPAQQPLAWLEYEQKTGRFYSVSHHHRRYLFTGYAGSPLGLNNPAMQHVRSQGPLPRGEYHMLVAPHPRFAAPAIRLRQTSGETFGRSGFWIHGDNAKLNHTASSGCIILGSIARRQLVGLIDDPVVRMSEYLRVIL